MVNGGKPYSVRHFGTARTNYERGADADLRGHCFTNGAQILWSGACCDERRSLLQDRDEFEILEAVRYFEVQVRLRPVLLRPTDTVWRALESDETVAVDVVDFGVFESTVPR